MPAANSEQIAFRGRVDDGSETGATWKAAQNTNWTQAVDVNFRVRFEIEEDAGGSLVLDGQLQYNLAAAGWNNVTASSAVVKAVASAQIVDGVATTDQMTGSALPFVAGSIDEVDGATAAVTLTSQSTQLEFVVTIVSGDVTDGQTLQLRVTDAGVALNVYTATPTITVSELAINLTGSLQAFWKLEEASGQRDDCFSTNHLTDNNTVTGNPGKIGNACQFTAANSEYLSIADNAALSSGDIDISIAHWVYLDSKGAQRPIVAKWSTGALEYLTLYDVTGDRYQVDFYNVSFGEVEATSFGSPATGVWHFIVAWHDSVANTVNIQVNDGPVDSVSYTAGMVDTTAPFEIGRNADGATFFNGRIDAVGIWKKVLNVNERSDLYNLGAGKEVCAGGTTYKLMSSMAMMGAGMGGLTS